jgi:hypothetical protein
MVEVALPKNWSIEVNGIYRPLHGSEREFGRSVRFAHLTWEFPVLAKYKFLSNARWRPFAEGGPSFRAEGNLNLAPVSHYGATVGAGVETRLRWLKISPAVRHTYWQDSRYSLRGRTGANQTEIIVAFSY